MHTEFAYCGNWLLLPELSFYEEGEPPESGFYHIQVDDDRASFALRWTPKGKAEVALSFGGPLDGQPRSVDQPPGAQASYSHISPWVLDSAMFMGGKQLMYARRQASKDGQLLAVLQTGLRGDGSPYRNTQVYRRID